MRIKRLLLIFWLALASLTLLSGSASPAYAQDSNPRIYVLTADGALSQPMADYVERSLRTASEQGAELIVLQLNTPGGSVDLMTRLEQDLLDSPVPVVVYVTPRGAMAGSAGAVITLAGHVAAMAPETAIGASSPVGASGEDLGQTEQAKLKNMYSATMRSLAERRGQKAVDLAVDMIQNARAVSAGEAQDAGLIDFIAQDLNDLLRQMDGFTVHMPSGDRVIHTAGGLTVPTPPSLLEQLLTALTNPNLVFLLLLAGVQAVLIELSSPGGWVAGFIGVVCLALAGYGLGILPVNWFGLVFLGTAFILFILDIKAPTHGALTAAGTASLIVGALVLFNTPQTPSFQRVSPGLVVGASVFTAIFFGFMVSFAIRAQKVPVLMGRKDTMLGKIGAVRSDLSPHGTVQLGSELWSAVAQKGEEPVQAGDQVEVVSVNGLELVVRRIK